VEGTELLFPGLTLSPLAVPAGNRLRFGGKDIAVRQKNQALKRILHKEIEADIGLIFALSQENGAYVFLCVRFEKVVAGFASLGAIGKLAEAVADESCEALLSCLKTVGALGPASR